MRRKNCCGVSITWRVCGCLQQVAVVERAQAEVLELAVALGVDRVVELARVVGDERRRARSLTRPSRVRRRDRLREGVDLLVARLPCRCRSASRRAASCAYCGSSAMSAGGGLDRELVELARGRAVVEAADRLGRDAHRRRRRRGPTQQRLTARTILLTSTGSAAPLRFCAPASWSAGHGDRHAESTLVAPSTPCSAIVSQLHGALLVSPPRAMSRETGDTDGATGARAGQRATRGRTFPPPARLQVDRPGCLPGADAGRSSGSRARPACAGFLAHRFPAPRGRPVRCGGSFSLTAAGQPRNLTGFPFARAIARAPAWAQRSVAYGRGQSISCGRAVLTHDIQRIPSSFWGAARGYSELVPRLDVLQGVGAVRVGGEGGDALLEDLAYRRPVAGVRLLDRPVRIDDAGVVPAGRRSARQASRWPVNILAAAGKSFFGGRDR